MSRQRDRVAELADELRRAADLLLQAAEADGEGEFWFRLGSGWALARLAVTKIDGLANESRELDSTVRVNRGALPPLPKPTDGVTDWIGRSEVCEALGIHEATFQSHVNNPQTELGKLARKVKGRWKVSAAELQELVRQRRGE